MRPPRRSKAATLAASSSRRARSAEISDPKAEANARSPGDAGAKDGGTRLESPTRRPRASILRKTSVARLLSTVNV